MADHVEVLFRHLSQAASVFTVGKCDDEFRVQSFTELQHVPKRKSGFVGRAGSLQNDAKCEVSDSQFPVEEQCLSDCFLCQGKLPQIEQQRTVKVLQFGIRDVYADKAGTAGFGGGNVVPGESSNAKCTGHRIVETVGR